MVSFVHTDQGRTCAIYILAGRHRGTQFRYSFLRQSTKARRAGKELGSNGMETSPEGSFCRIAAKRINWWRRFGLSLPLTMMICQGAALKHSIASDGGLNVCSGPITQDTRPQYRKTTHINRTPQNSRSIVLFVLRSRCDMGPYRCGDPASWD